MAEGQVVIGATHENDMQFDRRVTAGGMHEIFDKALTVAPKLADGTFVEARVGFRPFTPNFTDCRGNTTLSRIVYRKWARFFRIDSWTVSWCTIGETCTWEKSGHRFGLIRSGGGFQKFN